MRVRSQQLAPCSQSLPPKIESLKSDLSERKIDVAFLQEIWEKTDDPKMESEIKKMLELNGLLYVSSPRPLDPHGRAYGGTAIIMNTVTFEWKDLQVFVPQGLEVTWGLIKPWEG